MTPENIRAVVIGFSLPIFAIAGIIGIAIALSKEYWKEPYSPIGLALSIGLIIFAAATLALFHHLGK